jgi:hypothetical protein
MVAWRLLVTKDKRYLLPRTQKGLSIGKLRIDQPPMVITVVVSCFNRGEERDTPGARFQSQSNRVNALLKTPRIGPMDPLESFECAESKFSYRAVRSLCCTSLI